MNQAHLSEIALRLVSDNKGILAADESTKTIEKRFATIELVSTNESRRSYRELLFTTPDIEQYISGVILFDETVRQTTKDGKLFPQYLSERGILPGIKVDLGTTDLPETNSEKITLGLDGLQTRLHEYKQKGAEFAKWRAVYTISPQTPSEFALRENARVLAEYALMCQHAEIVPIVEPEILMDGGHNIDRCREVTTIVLTAVFEELNKHGVYLPGILLKPNMVIGGTDSTEESSTLVASATVEVLKTNVPTEVPGIVFLSGGQTPEQATLHLSEMNKIPEHPWKLSYSYGRALQEPVLLAWKGTVENVALAQQAFLKRARLNNLATKGEYTLELEQS